MTVNQDSVREVCINVNITYETTGPVAPYGNDKISN